MVQTLVDGLSAAAPGIRLHHVNPRLSHDAADIGCWRVGKLFALLHACAHAWKLRLRHGPMVFYYVPAPAKRSAFFRDLLVMLLCRPLFSQLVLHWHAVGLGSWLATSATPPERWLARALLGGANLAIVLAPELTADAQLLRPQRIAVVPNGISDTAGDLHGRNARATSQPPNRSTEVLFLGLGSREKGLFDTLTAVAIANRRTPGAFRLTVAGDFASAADEAAFRSQAATLGPEIIRHVGFAEPAQKHALFAAADVFCFPTHYAHEGQPLALIEALAHDVPIITTRWRAIPSMLPAEHVWFVDPGRPDQLAAALLATRAAPRPLGQLRAHYLARFTRERHLAVLAEALTAAGQ
jgi:glycosyltransferase involved in cell wall biosynthesis